MGEVQRGALIPPNCTGKQTSPVSPERGGSASWRWPFNAPTLKRRPSPSPLMNGSTAIHCSVCPRLSLTTRLSLPTQWPHLRTNVTTFIFSPCSLFSSLYFLFVVPSLSLLLSCIHKVFLAMDSPLSSLIHSFIHILSSCLRIT